MSEPVSDGTCGMRLGLAVARLSSAAWVGAATLFVVTALREVMHPQFDSATKDVLALLRFPAYYAFGFTLVTLAFVGSLGTVFLRPKGGRRLRLASVLLAVTLVLLAVDFAAVYRPMAGLINPPRPQHVAEFRAYHRVSIWLNIGHVGLCAVAAALLCWPVDRTGVAAGPSVE